LHAHTHAHTILSMCHAFYIPPLTQRPASFLSRIIFFPSAHGQTTQKHMHENSCLNTAGESLHVCMHSCMHENLHSNTAGEQHRAELARRVKSGAVIDDTFDGKPPIYTQKIQTHPNTSIRDSRKRIMQWWGNFLDVFITECEPYVQTPAYK
jgi:hypothetical protein